MSESEYGLFEIFSIESSRVTTNHSGHGNILSIIVECQFLNSKIVYVYW